MCFPSTGQTRPDPPAPLLPQRDRFVLEAGDVGQIAVQGSLVDHEYTFERDGSRIAEVSKRWVRVGDTDRVSKPGADIALTLAATAAIDSMTWEGCRRSR